MVIPQRTRLQQETPAPQLSGEHPTPERLSAPPVPSIDTQAALQQATTLLRQPVTGRGGSLQRSLIRLQQTQGNQGVQRLMRAAQGSVGGVAPGVESAIQHSRGLGHGLDHSTQAQMETAFGTDFSHVRLHTGSDADVLSQSLAARAFTTGSDIYFRHGEYNPGTSGGLSLLAHELTHVVQQRGVAPQAKLTVNMPGDVYEQEADAVAEQVGQLAKNPVRNRPPQQSFQRKFIQRQTQNSGQPASSDKAKLDQLHNAVRIIENKFLIDKGRRDEQEKINKDQWAVSWTAEAAGSIAGAFRGEGLHSLNIPDKSLWNMPDRLLKEVKEYIKAGDVIRAAHSLQNLVDVYTTVHEQLYHYIEGVIGGAEISQTGLEALATAGAIAASVATGGTTGLLVGAGYAAGQRIAGEVKGVLIGTQQKIDWAAIGFDALFAIAAGKLGGKLGGKLAEKLGIVIAARSGGQVTARAVTSVIVGRLSAVVHASAREVFDSIRWDTQLTVDGVIDRIVAQLTLKAVFVDLVTHAVGEVVHPQPPARPKLPPPKLVPKPTETPTTSSLPERVPESRPRELPAQGHNVISLPTRSGQHTGRATSEPFPARDEATARAFVPEPTVAPAPSPVPNLKLVPDPLPSSSSAKSPEPFNPHAGVAVAAVNEATPKKKQPTRRPIRLILPSVKAIHLEPYRKYAWAGALVHHKSKEKRKGVSQTGKWDAGMKPGRPEGMDQSVFERGLNLGLTPRQIFRPNWDRFGARLKDPTEVDHIIEIQLAPPGNQGFWDNIPNYELLDRDSNGASGRELRANIINERKELAAETNDPTWLEKPLKFEEVVANSGPQGTRWLWDEIRTGEHLDVYP
ncbi:MAG: DUF4157 domain-containing protein [Anaerolineae bacterium]|nr:DUF4157 domain-containing protein [Anaerolineae bacterium]